VLTKVDKVVCHDAKNDFRLIATDPDLAECCFQAKKRVGVDAEYVLPVVSCASYAATATYSTYPVEAMALTVLERAVAMAEYAVNRS